MRGARVIAICLFFFLFVLMLCPVPTAAQAVFGTISGTVTDSTGAVVAGATVRVINVNTGVVRTFETNEAGLYNANSLIPGTYKVEAEAPGFKTGVVSDIALVVNANPKIDIALQVGQKSETVSVTAEAPLLNTQQSSIGQTFNTGALSNLPLLSSNDGRGIFDLVKISAGISTQPGEGGYDGDNMRINGGRPRTDDYLLDGTSIQQPVWGGLAVSPSIDSIQEFRAETNNLSAEYGKVSGGVITIATKSGSNAFHGSVYEFLRNDALNARDYFLAPGAKKVPLRYNEFGATLGGPVIKNKLFFFVDYQGVRSSTSSFASGYLVPSAAFKNGDFSALSTPITDPTTGSPFTNNQIPTARFSPASVKMMALWPDPQNPSNCVLGVCSNSGTNADRGVINRSNVRVDYTLSQSDHLFGVYHYQDGRDNLTGQFPNQTSWQSNPAKALTLAWTHTFGPSMLNDFRFGWNKRSPGRVPYGYGKVGPSDFNLTGLPECTLPQSNGKCGQPNIKNITGYTAVGGGESMLFEPAGNFSITDTVTKQFGRHNLKFGGEIRRYWIDNIQPNRENGEFNFLGSATGNSFADFLLGLVDNGQTDIQSDYVSSRMLSHAYFVQDDWRVTPKLTLNLGMRYQIDRSWRETHHLVASFNPYTLQWEIPGVNGVPEGNINPDYREFGPRIGFAWNPNGSFVVRGGYGIMYPGSIGHGRSGDGNPSPNVLATTVFRNVQWDHLPAFNLPDPKAPLTISQASGTSYIQRDQRQTYIQQWNFTLEHQLGRDTLFALSYIGSKGTRLPDNYYYNACQPLPEQVLQYGEASWTMDSPYCAPGNGVLGNYGGIVIHPDWHLIASSIYHAMTAKVEKRYSNGLSLLGTFTWSKLIDDSSSDWGGFGALDALPQDYRNRKAERSVSQGDVPLILSIAPVYDLPFGRKGRWVKEGFLSEIVGGWQVSGIYQAQKGGPIGIFDGSWGGNAYLLRSSQVRPNITGNPLPSGFQQTLDHWFDGSVFNWDTTNFINPTLPLFGDAPRFMSSVRAPGVNNLNLSFAKSNHIPGLGEEGRLQFRVDMFNAFNHPQFGPPGVQNDSNLGRITSTRLNMRTIQLSLHLYF